MMKKLQPLCLQKTYEDVIDKLCYQPNLIYFDFLSYIRSYKLNGILAHYEI
jgi:hypothetical protein